ncbi:fluoride efflux transporter FluC [Bacillaceae bacterium W0354]
MKKTLTTWVYIAFGGAIGAVSRASLGSLLKPLDFPLATLLVNLIGSLLLGGLTAFLYKKHNEKLHLLIGIGFCGSFTTMSTFALESTGLLNDLTSSIVYIFISVMGGILLAFIGFLVISMTMKKGEQ